MSVRKVSQTITGGGLGAATSSPEGKWCVMGNCSAGTANVPTKFAGGTQRKLVEQFGYGRAVQLAALLLAFGYDVVFLKMANTTAGDIGTDEADNAFTFVGTGTSVLTTTGAPYDEYTLVFECVTGGTIGTTGIKFRLSFDGGLTWGQTISLGTANTYAIPNRGISIAFAAGTLVALDRATAYAKAPKWGTADITSAFAALRNSQHDVESVFLDGPVSSTEAAFVKTAIAASHNIGKFIRVLSPARKQNVAESEATWLAALVADYAAFTENFLAVSAGQIRAASAVDGDGSLYMRPAGWVSALRSAGVPVHEDLGRVKRGALYGTLVDSNNVLIAHDESVTPGLDDERFLTLTTYPGKRGAFVTKPRTMAPAGSDFGRWQDIGVILKVARITYQELLELLGDHVRVNPKTGYALEKDLQAIEGIVNGRLYREVVQQGNATSCRVILSRTDAILSTRRLTAETRTVPNGYIDEIVHTIAFENPALTTTG